MSTQKAIQQKLSATQLVFGLIFGLLVICALGYLQYGGGFEAVSAMVTSGSSASPPKDAFNASLPESARIELIRKYLAGDWHEPPVVNDAGASHTNYTFGADGSLKAWQCSRWGESSERVYKPYDRDGTVHTYKVEEDRYVEDGRIFYNVIRGDGILWEYPHLQIDRDKGFVAYLPRADTKKPLDRGHSTDCS